MKRLVLLTTFMFALAVTVGCGERDVAKKKPLAPGTSPPGMGGDPADPGTMKRPEMGLPIGSEAPDIDGIDLDGKAFKLSDYKGKVVMLDFYGHW